MRMRMRMRRERRVLGERSFWVLLCSRFHAFAMGNELFSRLMDFPGKLCSLIDRISGSGEN